MYVYTYILISNSNDIYIIGIACSSLGACARGCCPASSLMRAPPGRLDASFAVAFVIRPLGHSCQDYLPVPGSAKKTAAACR